MSNLLTHRCTVCGLTYSNPDHDWCVCGHGLVEYNVKVE